MQQNIKHVLNTNNINISGNKIVFYKGCYLQFMYDRGNEKLCRETGHSFTQTRQNIRNYLMI